VTVSTGVTRSSRAPAAGGRTWSTRAPAAEIGFGVYVHIPFCASKCDYCAFATFTDRSHLESQYLRALRMEIERASQPGTHPSSQPGTQLAPLPLASAVFVGGGTPSHVNPRELVHALDAIPRRSDAEFTIECNPDDVTVELLNVYRSIGVNRVSIGMQSASPHVLAALGRTHSPDAVARAVAAVREAGLSTFNLDVIYGGVGESIDDWVATVQHVVALGAPHVSAYGLTVEAGTALADDASRHPDDDDQADKYDAVDDILTAAGYVNYEISNWAKPGYECKLNAIYWSGGNYAGFGCAAHAHRDGRRSWNVRTPDRYIELIEAGRSAESSFEELDPTTRSLERLQLQLRTRDGVPVAALDALDVEEMGELVHRIDASADASATSADASDARLVLTRAGRLLANEVSLRLRG
jgi:putative oxygen-independent coproporphyrinogen III oxidase